MLVKIWKSTSK